MEKARANVSALVERFRENLDVYKNIAYNEAQTRREFIDPFFMALGWDVTNRAGYAEQYKDVVHEDSVKVGSTLKAPDYSFRVGGVRKFFLEAKRPSVSIKDDVSPAYQLRRYAWSAKLPLSILTDFEELAVYDCRVKPAPTDKVSTGRVALYTFEDYLKKFDEIYGTFSKDAVLKGSFDRYILSTKKKRGTAEVDREFLKEIEAWREALARNIALRNPSLTVEELNFSVQQTIDRIIFLRISEDRGMENYGRLRSHLNGPNTYSRLFELFYEADTKYNSGLFDFKADALTRGLAIDDKVLKGIIDGLYYPKSPYEFSVLGVEILGNVYEQFLGKVIRLTAGHKAKVEEKPEVKKAGGVYYTPEYIVEYIVKNTVGRLLEGKSPKKAEKLKVLDPACGSGSFLIGAYKYLLDYHLGWYRESGPEKHARGKRPAVYRGAGGEWRLTTQEKKRILINNIFGVDIDRQAVEVTKLSLLLKVLEDESGETLGKNLALFRERALPNLKDNIKCGNSLIGPDFYETPPLFPPLKKGGLGGVSDGDARRINAFDWNDSEKGFGAIMRGGGFDCVIGNPPYGAWFTKKEDNYFANNFKVFSGVKDVYALFIERGLALLQDKKLISFIVPSAWIGGPSYLVLRKMVLENKIDKILMLPFDVFENAYIDTLITVISKESPHKAHFVKTFIYPKKEKLFSIQISPDKYFNVKQTSWIHTENQKFVLDPYTLSLIKKLRKTTKHRFADIIKIKRGVLFEKELLRPMKVSDKHFRYFEGDVYRYTTNEVITKWVEFGPMLKERPKDFDWFQGKRILLRRLVNRRQRLMASLARNTYITNKNLYIIKSLDSANLFPETILGILNSKLISHIYLHQVSQATKDDFPQVTIRDIMNLPFPAIELHTKELTKLVTLVDSMLELNKKLRAVKTPHDRELIERRIKGTDNRIDRLVYDLYGLTEEEVRVVEGS